MADRDDPAIAAMRDNRRTENAEKIRERFGEHADEFTSRQAGYGLTPTAAAELLEARSPEDVRAIDERERKLEGRGL